VWVALPLVLVKVDITQLNQYLYAVLFERKDLHKNVYSKPFNSMFEISSQITQANYLVTPRDIAAFRGGFHCLPVTTIFTIHQLLLRNCY
jgi:hypothetical protein